MPQPSHVGIIGAGIIGLSTALWLQRAGLKVSLIDRNEPGEGTSFGNAGVFADYGRVPFASMSQLKQLPSMLMDRESPLSVQTRYVPKLLPYGLRFLQACKADNFESGCQAMAQLQNAAALADTELLSATNANDLVRATGALALCSTEQGLKSALDGHLRLRAELGTRVEPVNRQQVADMEPDLGDFYAGGAYYPNTRFTVSPIALSKRYADHFLAAGGEFVRGSVTHLLPAEERCTVVTEHQRLSFDHVVVCTGVASAKFASQVGVTIPLVSERGYHVMLEPSQTQLSRPVVWLDKATFLTPMQDGIRVAGTAEFAAQEAKPSQNRSDMMIKNAAIMLGREPRVRSTWVGSRPSTPDSLPVIGRAPASRRVLLAFGHGHLGLTLAAVTGRLITESICQGHDTPETQAFSPYRYI